MSLKGVRQMRLVKCKLSQRTFAPSHLRTFAPSLIDSFLRGWVVILGRGKLPLRFGQRRVELLSETEQHEKLTFALAIPRRCGVGNKQGVAEFAFVLKRARNASVDPERRFKEVVESSRNGDSSHTCGQGGRAEDGAHALIEPTEPA